MSGSSSVLPIQDIITGVFMQLVHSSMTFDVGLIVLVCYSFSSMHVSIELLAAIQINQLIDQCVTEMYL